MRFSIPISYRQSDFQDYLQETPVAFRFDIFWEPGPGVYHYHGHAWTQYAKRRLPEIKDFGYRGETPPEWIRNKDFRKHVEGKLKSIGWVSEYDGRVLQSKPESEVTPNQWAYAKAVSSSPFEIEYDDGDSSRVNIIFSDGELVQKEMGK